jgi:hypothetical protein
MLRVSSSFNAHKILLCVGASRIDLGLCSTVPRQTYRRFSINGRLQFRWRRNSCGNRYQIKALSRILSNALPAFRQCNFIFGSRCNLVSLGFACVGLILAYRGCRQRHVIFGLFIVAAWLCLKANVAEWHCQSILVRVE